MNMIREKHYRLLKLAVSLVLITVLLCSCSISANQVIINPNTVNNINNANSTGSGSPADGNESGNTNTTGSGNNSDNTNSSNSAQPGGNTNSTGSENSAGSIDNTGNSAGNGGTGNGDNTGNSAGNGGTGSGDNTGNSAGNGGAGNTAGSQGNDNTSGNTGNNADNTDPKPTPRSWAEETLDNMTLTEKIGQLFIIRPDQLDPDIDTQKQHSMYDGVTEFSDEMRACLKEYPVGGFIIFDKNLTDPEQAMNFVAEMKELSAILPFISIDEEGGKISRIANSRYKGFEVQWVPAMGVIGESGDINEARKAGNTIGKYLKEFGFNLNFAPIADLDDSESEGVIGERSFGTDPQTVSAMISAFIEGMHENGILSCLKHFPGQGSAEVDTHEDYSEISSSWDEILQSDMIPFMNNKDQTDMIMAAHISCPNVTGNNLPASLSKILVTNKLRNELKYKGVIITDSFHMGAITNTYSSGDAAVMAIKAGVDIILMPDDFTEAFNALITAVKSGEISEERINESVLRILDLKEKIISDY